MKPFYSNNRTFFLLFSVLFVCFSAKSFAQNLTVHGIVKDSATNGLIGAAVVRIVNSNITPVLTNANGEFSIPCSMNDQLLITCIGYKSGSIKVSDTSFIQVLLSSTSVTLNDVVVTATGIKKEAKRLGYAVQTVNASTLTQAREPDPINSLKGQVAGLTININQEVAHAPNVIIRGENDPNNQPMFVVDGVSIHSDTYNISPDDIETYTVLKGPSAAALYGFEGKNGAIIITTKKGTKKGKGFSIDINSTTQINSGFIAMPKVQSEYGAGDNGIYAFGGGGLNGQTGINDVDMDVWGPRLNGQLLPQFDGPYNANQTYTTTFQDGHAPFVGHIQPTPWVARGKDNLQHFLQAGILSSNSIALSSSSEKTDVRISIANTYQRGLIPNTSLNNLNFAGNVTQRFSSKLTLNSYVNYSRQSTPNIPDVTYGANSPIYNLVLWSGADVDVRQLKNYWYPGKVGVQQYNNEYFRYNNPYFVAHQWLSGHYVNNVYGYLSLNYKLNDNIDFLLRPSISTYDMTNSEKLPWSASSYGRYTLRQGDYRLDKRSLFESNVEFQARYHKDNILDFLDVQGLIGANARNFKFNSNYTSTDYLNVPGIYSFSNSVYPLLGSSFNSAMKVLSAYYSLDLGYKSYITANITGRVDKSSALPTSNDVYFYPSFNLATVVSDYVKLPSIISFLKFRASYAESKDAGTIATFTPQQLVLEGLIYGYSFPSPYGGPNYQYSQTYSIAPTYNNQSSGSYANQTVSPALITQPSNRQATEVGMDARFLHNRIGLDVTYYHYKNTIVTSEATSLASGYSSTLTDNAAYSNNGWEVSINANPIKNPNGFSWNVIANWFTYIRKWINDPTPDNYEYNGQRIDLVYGNAFIRTPDGKFVIDPSSGLQVSDANLGVSTLKVFGHSDPDWQWGLINTFSYKNFSLRFQFDGSVGGVIEDGVRKKMLQGGTQIETIEGAFGKARPDDALANGTTNKGTYVAPGVVLIPKVPGTTIQIDPKTEQIINLSDFIEQANTTATTVQAYVSNMAAIPDLDMVKKTYGKLREVTISYHIPEKVFGKNSFIQGASVSLVGRNLLYFFPSRFKDFDVDQYQTLQPGAATLNPNTPTPAGAYTTGLQTPTTRSYGINVNLSF